MDFWKLHKFSTKKITKKSCAKISTSIY